MHPLTHLLFPFDLLLPPKSTCKPTMVPSWSEMDRYIFFHLYWYFLGGKLEELVCRAHFSGRSQFGNLGSRTFQRHFEASNGTFWGQNFASIVSNTLTLLYTPKLFKQCENHLNGSSYAEVMPLASWSTLFTTMVPSGYHVNTHYSHM
jgi:hypothetical protein